MDPLSQSQADAYEYHVHPEHAPLNKCYWNAMDDTKTAGELTSSFDYSRCYPWPVAL